jgi:hypothetical protein
MVESLVASVWTPVLTLCATLTAGIYTFYRMAEKRMDQADARTEKQIKEWRQEHREDMQKMDLSMQKMDEKFTLSMQKMDEKFTLSMQKMDEKWAHLFGLFAQKLK